MDMAQPAVGFLFYILLLEEVLQQSVDVENQRRKKIPKHVVLLAFGSSVGTNKDIN